MGCDTPSERVWILQSIVVSLRFLLLTSRASGLVLFPDSLLQAAVCHSLAGSSSEVTLEDGGGLYWCLLTSAFVVGHSSFYQPSYLSFLLFLLFPSFLLFQSFCSSGIWSGAKLCKVLCVRIGYYVHFAHI